MADITTNTTTAKGLEGAIISASKSITKIQSKIDGVFWGKYSLSKEDAENATFAQRLQDRGIVYALDIISSVDLCNIINYAIQQIPAGKRFNPDDPNKPTDPLGRAKWNLQYKAYEVQTAIDDYYTSYGDAKNKDSKLGLQSVVKFVQDAFAEILNPESQQDFNNPELVNAFPELQVFNNFIQNSLGVFNQYTDLRNIPNEDLQKTIQKIDKIREICVAIQGLNSPTALLGFADTLLTGKLQEEISKITKVINPARITPTLRGIINTCNSITQVARVIMNYVNFGRVIIRLCVLLVKIFKRILDFLVFLGIPNVYTTLGITNKMSTVANKQIQVNGIDNFVNRLNQINAFLGLIVNFIGTLIIDLQTIIDKINILLVNLQGCDNVDPQIVKDLEAARNSMIAERQNLVDFVTGYNTRKKAQDNTFGGYTIKIITEETTDIEFKIKRRYGIAIDKDGNLALESTPTYASIDSIIINEVKQLLMSKGLVKNGTIDATSDQLQTINEALNFLDDNNINVDSLTTSSFNDGLDDADNENEDSGLGLNAFVNKLSGGKKLRRRMRKVMAEQSTQLKTDLAGMRS